MTRSLINRICKGQVTFSGHVIRRGKMLDGLTKWLNVE